MKRHPTLVPISREHHHLLIISQVCKTDVPTYKGYPTEWSDLIARLKSEYETLIKPHAEREETLLFPFLLNQSSEFHELVSELQKEHQLISEGFSSLNKDTTKEELDALGHLLHNHIRKEERGLFPKIQELLTEGELEELERVLWK